MPVSVKDEIEVVEKKIASLEKLSIGARQERSNADKTFREYKAEIDRCRTELIRLLSNSRPK